MNKSKKIRRLAGLFCLYLYFSSFIYIFCIVYHLFSVFKGR